MRATLGPFALLSLCLIASASCGSKPASAPKTPEPPPPPPAVISSADKAESLAPAEAASPKVQVPLAPGYGAGVAGGAYRAASAWPPSGPPFNTETYDYNADNAWKLVANDPLSTFSVDVDTASYANVRRFLNGGTAPPPDAVRIEELLNYFSYDYPTPTAAHPFSVTTELGPCAWAPQHKLLLVGVQGRRIDVQQLPPRNLVFLIDVSGSMAPPNKLPLVKASLTMLAAQLTSRDRIAIVVYAGASGLALPSTAGDDRSRILSALAQLQAGGSTNGAQGLELAYQQAQAHFIPGGVNRVILATDGDFNVGVTDRGSLVRMIEEKRAQGVALSVLGFGMGNLKDATMEQLADKGNGNYAYIDSMQEANKVLVTEAGGTLVTIAKDVKLQLEFNPRHVGAFRLIGYENRVLAHQDFKDDKKDAGEIGAGHSVTALYEIVPRGVPLPSVPEQDSLKYQRPSGVAESPEWLTVKLRYKQPDSETSVPLEVAVHPNDSRTMSRNLGFASAVAAFGMSLRNSPFKGSADFNMAVTLGRRHRGDDVHGHRAEFTRLAEVAASLSKSREGAPH
jgi:Ca-activated chloride channel family protein